jgi:hypothetical protein
MEDEKMDVNTEGGTKPKALMDQLRRPAHLSCRSSIESLVLLFDEGQPLLS